VNEMAKQTATAMAEAASAVAELARQSQDLGLLVNEMRQG